MAGSRKNNHTLRRFARAFAQIAVIAIACSVWSIPAHPAIADEALLPDDADAADSVQEIDPTLMGAAPVGREPDAEQLKVSVDAYLDNYFADSGIPGLAVAVVDSQGVRYERAMGDVDSTDDTFIIGSLSKSMTSAAVQQLVDKGLVDLDAPAALYAPELGVPDSVTVRSLLNQTSGFGYYESLDGAQVGEHAGEFSYANANYDLLGRIVEDVSGMGLGEYLRANVFGPLGMRDASLDGEGPCAPAATGHRNWFGLAVADGFSHERGDDAWGGPASGYVRASIDDMASYLRMYLNSGGGVVTPAGIHRMVFDRVPDPGGDTFYGMGWSTYRWGDGEPVMSHDGDVENYVARMLIVPGRDLGVVLLADENDAVEGNSTFWQIGDDVVSLAVGGEAMGTDGAGARRTHALFDAAYLLAVAACAAPLLLRRRPRACDRFERRVRVAWGIFLHGAAPAAILLYPLTFGMRLRDFAAFYPEQAVVGSVCAALLLVGGARRLRLCQRGRCC